MSKFTEPSPLNDVSKFHEVFDLPVEDSPKIPSSERCALRINLIEEELKELKEAIENEDIVEVADAFCDLQYVLSGAILEFGLGSKFKALFEEVQRSNMSKTCKSMEEALRTQQYYRTQRGIESHIIQRNGEFLVYRTEDGKVLKSVNYSPAEISKMV